MYTLLVLLCVVKQCNKDFTQVGNNIGCIPTTSAHIFNTVFTPYKASKLVEYTLLVELITRRGAHGPIAN